MTKKAVITGSFNPVTSGHLFLLEQAQKLFDEVYMVILINPEKTYKLSLEKRLSLLKDAVKPFDNVKIFAYDGFACDFCLSVGANLMLRGVRNDKDLQYELDLRRQNLEYKGIDTMILVTDEKHKKRQFHVCSGTRSRIRRFYG